MGSGRSEKWCVCMHFSRVAFSLLTLERELPAAPDGPPSPSGSRSMAAFDDESFLDGSFLSLKPRTSFMVAVVAVPERWYASAGKAWQAPNPRYMASSGAPSTCIDVVSPLSWQITVITVPPAAPHGPNSRHPPIPPAERTACPCSTTLREATGSSSCSAVCRPLLVALLLSSTLKPARRGCSSFCFFLTRRSEPSDVVQPDQPLVRPDQPLNGADLQWGCRCCPERIPRR